MNDAVMLVGTAVCRGILSGAQCYHPDVMLQLGYSAFGVLAVVLLTARALARA